MKIHLLFLAFLLAGTSSQCQEIKKMILDDSLVAKSVIGVQDLVPKSLIKTEYTWYLATSQDGSWEMIPGVWTDEIVLLTTYSGEFLKCEISGTSKKSNNPVKISIEFSKPVEFRGNPNADWFRDAGYGIMVHFLKDGFCPDGGSKEWNETVNAFDVGKFAAQAHEAGAGYVMFTLGQNSGYYCSPNHAFDKAVGVNPGDLCSKRDLPMDLAKALKKYHIPLILYLPSNPPVGNKLVSEKFRYPYKKDSATTDFNQSILEDMIREWSLRYGKLAKGWWFDGLYSWNNIRSTRMDMSRKHNISTHTLAAKAGNKSSIVTYNSGFGKIHANTPYCDYTSGEKSTIDEFPQNRWAEDGVQWFLFTYLGEKWGGRGSQFETEKLTEMAEKIVKNEGVLCLEVVPNPNGEIIPHHFEQIRAVGQKLGKVR